MKAVKVLVTVLLIGFIIGSGTVFAADGEGYTLTLTEAKKLALEKSNEIEKARVSLELARITHQDAERAYDFAVYNWSLTGGNSSALKEVKDNARKSRDLAEYNYENTRQALDNAKELLQYNVENLYLGILNLENTIAIQEETYRLQQTSVKIERLKKDLGMSTQTAIDQLVKNVMDMEKALQELYNLRISQYWQMKTYIGRPLDSPLYLTPVSLEPGPIDNKTNTYNNVLQTYLAIKQLNQTIEHNKFYMDYHKYEGTEKVEKLEFELKQTELNLADLEYVLQVNIKNLYEKLELANKSLLYCKMKYDYALTDYKASELRFNLGLLSKQTYDSMKLTFEQSRAEYEKAGYDYYLAIRQIQLAEKGIFATSASQ